MTWNQFILGLLCLTMTACAFKKEDAKEKEAAKTTTEALNQFEQSQTQKKQSEVDGGQLTDQNISVEFVEMPEPGSYKMRVSWPRSVVSMAVQMDDEFETATVKESVYERAVEQGSSHRLRLISKNSDGIEVSRKELIRTAPKDLIVKQNISLLENTDMNVNRIFFYPQAKIITNGYNLAINTKKMMVFAVAPDKITSGIFWSEAHILTAVPAQQAQREVQLKGSEISITAEQAQGHLRIAFLGLDGKDGRSGDELDRDAHKERTFNPALNGGPGEPGSIKSVNMPCLKRALDATCEGSQLRCQKSPTNGGDGRAGEDGTPGEDGQPGGDTGTLFLSIADSTNFSVEVGQRVGNPGHGGNGGVGSPGGLGGKAGHNPGSPCPDAQDGKNGAQGLTGRAGATGAPGKLGTIRTGAVKTTVFPL